MAPIGFNTANIPVKTRQIVFILLIILGCAIIAALVGYCAGTLINLYRAHRQNKARAKKISDIEVSIRLSRSSSRIWRSSGRQEWPPTRKAGSRSKEFYPKSIRPTFHPSLLLLQHTSLGEDESNARLDLIAPSNLLSTTATTPLSLRLFIPLAPPIMRPMNPFLTRSFVLAVDFAKVRLRIRRRRFIKVDLQLTDQHLPPSFVLCMIILSQEAPQFLQSLRRVLVHPGSAALISPARQPSRCATATLSSFRAPQIMVPFQLLPNDRSWPLRSTGKLWRLSPVRSMTSRHLLQSPTPKDRYRICTTMWERTL